MDRDTQQNKFIVLPAEAQLELCRTYRAGIEAQQRMCFSPPDDFSVFLHLLDRIRAGHRARELLILHTTGLVKDIARRFHYTTTVLSLEDLEHDGFIGLFRAVELFDPGQDVRFVTYAHYWIRQAMQRSILAVGKTMKVPAHRQGLLSKIYKTRQRLEQEQGGAVVTCEQVASVAEVDITIAQTIWWADAPALSLNNQVKRRDRVGEYLDILQSPDTPVQEVVSTNNVSHKLKAVLESDYLTAREARIIHLSFYEDMTLDQIGKKYGLTRERVRQIKKIAQDKLKQHPDIQHLWRDFGY